MPFAAKSLAMSSSALIESMGAHTNPMNKSIITNDDKASRVKADRSPVVSNTDDVAEDFAEDLEER